MAMLTICNEQMPYLLQPSDEYQADWDFAGMEEMAKFTFAIGMDAANQ